MPTDNGGAPCVHAGFLSLAICKPKVRKTADVDSLIFGFGGKDYRERLIYVARVTRKFAGTEYYTSREFARRPDCIYRSVDGRAVLRPKAHHHANADHRRKDVGFRFENAFVLFSGDFRYFGANGTADYKRAHPALKSLIEGLKQGHRRNHSEQVRADLIDLKNRLWKQYRKRVLGRPTESDSSAACNVDMGSLTC